tara:strand:+ start:346 stop:570 length:225 start_codon:yes stop_codon:yes gene_type:complete
MISSAPKIWPQKATKTNLGTQNKVDIHSEIHPKHMTGKQSCLMKNLRFSFKITLAHRDQIKEYNIIRKDMSANI